MCFEIVCWSSPLFVCVFMSHCRMWAWLLWCRLWAAMWLSRWRVMWPKDGRMPPAMSCRPSWTYVSAGWETQNAVFIHYASNYKLKYKLFIKRNVSVRSTAKYISGVTFVSFKHLAYIHKIFFYLPNILNKELVMYDVPHQSYTPYRPHVALTLIVKDHCWYTKHVCG